MIEDDSVEPAAPTYVSSPVIPSHTPASPPARLQALGSVSGTPRTSAAAGAAHMLGTTPRGVPNQNNSAPESSAAAEEEQAANTAIIEETFHSFTPSVAVPGRPFLTGAGF